MKKTTLFFVFIIMFLSFTFFTQNLKAQTEPMECSEWSECLFNDKWMFRDNINGISTRSCVKTEGFETSRNCTPKPVIESISPSVIYSGNKVTITGYNFGLRGLYSYETYCPKCQVKINDKPASVYQDYSWSNTNISFTMPTDAKSGYITIIDKNGTESNQFNFTLTAPVQETKKTNGSFTLKLPTDRDGGLKIGDKVYIDYYGSSMIASAYLNNIKLELYTVTLDVVSYYPSLIHQNVFFIITSTMEGGSIIVNDASGGGKNIGNITIYTPPINCSKFGKSSYNETSRECECQWGYELNNHKTECISKDFIKKTSSGLLIDTDNDGVPDNNDFYPNKKSELITKNYSFNYMLLGDNYGKRIDIKIEVPQDLYFYYQNQNHIFNESFNNITSFITYDDLVIKNIANQIEQLYKSQNFNPITVAYQLVSQIVYTSDKFSIKGWDEYPKYPIETIAERSGDCEDTTFLMAALLKALNAGDPWLVRFDTHLGLAAFVSDKPDGSKNIFYIETTGNGTNMPGIMPSALVGKEYTLHALDEYKRVKYINKQIENNIVNKTLKLGNRGEDVKKLQQFLIDNKYLKTNQLGYFGTLTKNALKKFQKANKLKQSGALDQITINTINN